jgi:hypothetical protein
MNTLGRRTINKLPNDYERVLGGFFDDCPKAVLAAIAVSYATCGGDRLNEGLSALALEWDRLHQTQIVPQALPAKWRATAAEARAREENDNG